MNCNIKRRTIMIFPQFENVDIINEIREKYDPLANHVKPHITIGNFTSRDGLNKAFNDVSAIKENFTTIVDKVSVEIIDENEDSIIEIEVSLSNNFMKN